MPRLCFLFLALLLLLSGCHSNGQQQEEEECTSATDLPQLKEKGKLTAVTLYSSTSYFQYKMQPMGYEYDLIEDFAQSQGLELEIKIAQSTAQLVSMLHAGEADVIAYPIFISNQSKQEVLFCGHEQQTSQVIVQRANKGDKILKDVTELIGKKIYVQKNSKYEERLNNLNQELGGGLDIVSLEKDSLSNEDLISMVSKGEIPYTVSDDNMARLNKTYYWNINIQLKISFPQRSSWAVRKDAPLLAAAINEWATDTKRNQSFRTITKRYFELSKVSEGFDIPEVKNGHISPYDNLFKKHAEVLGWDWRLLASISYQESKFNPHVVSWAGAEGLMGIMPNTARRLGVSPHELKDPDAGIRTGVECLRRFRQGFSEITDPEEKIKFTLAAYNAGIGHVYDAQKLAEKYGKDPLVWDKNVAEFIRLKNDPEYYNDPVCKHGYLRGSETFAYVSEIMKRYEYYQKKAK
ncbi:MAG: transporter substrate-binding domain-containing protein [Bacteroidales bacterium]|nr:transporter substrate-binding domain-containing protein [Parabacteroides sp.]MDY5622049.1 transporter substrate-binding domain-containing protein [Bacteroidales bacterium]